MKNSVFGDICFNSGWETSREIEFKEKVYKVVVSADAYFEEDDITKEQEEAYASFIKNQEGILVNVASKLKDNTFIPTLLLFKRNGDYGLVFDDANDTEGGIVVTIAPKMEIVSVDQYL